VKEKIHTNEQSVNHRQRNDTAIFGEKLSITALGNGKQTLLSARQKLTATGSRFHIKANSRDGQNGKRLGHDVSSSTTVNDTTTPTPQPQYLPICVNVNREYRHVITFGFMSHALFCEVKLCIEANESYVHRRWWNT
jgi:hypothetical protein